MSSSPPRDAQLQVAYASDFAVQVDIDTALDNSAIDAIFNRNGTITVEFVDQTDRVIDCSGNWPIDEIVLAKSSRLQFGIEADASDLFGLLGWGMGVVAGDIAQVLPANEYELPLTTFIVGFNGTGGTKIKLKSMALDELVITADGTSRITATVSFRGHGTPASGADYDFPDCSTPTPTRLSDGAFTLNGEDRKVDLVRATFTYRNALDPADMHISTSVDIARNERATLRETFLEFALFGQYDDDFNEARARTKMGWAWRIGPADDGLLLTAANGIQIYNGRETVGPFGRNANVFRNDPILIPGNLDTPTVAEYLS